MPDDCEPVGGVGGCGCLEGGEDAGLGFEPAVVAVGVVSGDERWWIGGGVDSVGRDTHNPWWQKQRGQMSVGMSAKSRSAAQLRKECEPRNARMVRPRVWSTAM